MERGVERRGGSVWVRAGGWAERGERRSVGEKKGDLAGGRGVEVGAAGCCCVCKGGEGERAEEKKEEGAAAVGSSYQ